MKYDLRFADAIRLYKLALSLSRQHSYVAIAAMAAYGDHGPQVSGIVRDHFPEHVKRELRELCRRMNEASDAAWAARPAWVRRTTMLKLFAHLKNTEGSGFYL